MANQSNHWSTLLDLQECGQPHAADLYSRPSRDIVYDRLLSIAQTILDGTTG